MKILNSLNRALVAVVMALLWFDTRSDGVETDEIGFNLSLNAHAVVLSNEEYASFIAARETNPPPDLGIRWGEATNGIRCGITLRSWPEIRTCVETPLTTVPYPTSTFLQSNPPAQTTPPVIGYGNGDSGDNNAVWIGAPNGFFGPMELRNAEGKKMKLLKSEMNNPEAYPELLVGSVLKAQTGGMFLGNRNGPRIGQWHEFQKYRNVQQAEGALLQLKGTFLVTEPGEYQLILWPKIYKRSEKPGENHNIYQRIDLPPVSVPIHWPENNRQ